MRLKPSNTSLLLVVCFTLTFAFSAIGQEEKGQGDTDPVVKETLRNDPDPASLTESERTVSKPTLTPATKETLRDSTVQTKPVRPLKAIDKVPKEEDPLSFNFLYYIIEKFKLSDIIE